MKTLFWHSTGPLLQYDKGTLTIADLNPQMSTQWTIGRAAAVRIALRLLVAAVTH